MKGNRLAEKIKQHWFLLSLAFVFAAVVSDGSGYVVLVGKTLNSLHGPDIVIFTIFFISGLIIEIQQIRDGIKDARATLAALFVIVLVSPAAAFGLSLFSPGQGILIGLFIVSVMPTTLSSGIVMTGRAGGNMAHALCVTIFSNMISIVSIPFVLSYLLPLASQSKELSIDRGMIMLRLCFLVLLPLITGLFVKRFALSGHVKRKRVLQNINQVLVVLIVFMAASKVKNVLDGSTNGFFLIVLYTAVFHLVLLSASFAAAKGCGIKGSRNRSVLFMGSQKTLPLSVIIQMTYFPAFPNALLVCVVHHFVHLFIDGYLAVKLKK